MLCGSPITVGVIDSSAPVFYKDEESGEYVGIAIEMMEMVSQKTGMDFEYVPVDISRARNAKTPNAKSPQVVVGITYCENLPDERDWFLSDSLLNDKLAVVEMRGRKADVSFGKKVAVMAGFIMAREYAEIYMSEYEIVEYPTLENCLDAVTNGEADAALYLSTCINYLLQRPRYEKLEINPTYSENIHICVAGFTDESQVFINEINKGLGTVSENEYRSIVLNYTILNPYQLTMEDTLYKYRIQLILVAVLLITVIASLSALYIMKRRNERKVAAALVLAEQASAAKGNFMSHMSHEIRTPLNAIIGYNTIAKNELREAKTDAERRQAEMRAMDCLTKSDIASRNLLAVINDVLDMSAIESNKIKITHDFKSLINSLTILFYSQAKAKNIKFDVVFNGPTEEWLVGDQMRINQILTNLLSNAVKFTSEGTVELTVKQTNLDDKTAGFHFEVTDTGIGMKADYLEHIWTPFEQADGSISRRFGGTGLGMSITKKLVDLMDGEVNVESTLGKGTRFSVDIKLERTKQPLESEMYDFSSLNALVIDDDVSTCNYIKLLFDRCGVACTTATSGEEALRLVTSGMENNIEHNVCLVDWHMPGMDGIETIKKIRGITGNKMLIIVVTAYDYTEISGSAEAAGVNMFISKPLFQSSLFDLLADICGHKKPVKLEKSEKYSFGGARVLLAEDNNMNMEIAKELLESAGLLVDIAWDGRSVVDKFTSSPAGTYSAILMDVHMPELNGHEASRIIRASDCDDAKTVPIIAMTADAFAENVTEAYESGMNAHISKPINTQTLFEVLNKNIVCENKKK